MLHRLESQRVATLWDAGRWRERAACYGMQPDLFFPVGERAEEAVEQIAEAKAVCAGCSVRLHCLTFALVANTEDGVWAGMAPSERAALRRLRRHRRRAGAVPITSVRYGRSGTAARGDTESQATAV